jgi:hypothetical protein
MITWLLALAVGVFVVLIAAAFALAGAWPVMIGLGILHSYWHQVPAFGFLATAVLLWGLGIVLSRLHPSAVTKDD